VGGQVAIAQGDEVLLSRPYGTVAIDSKVPVKRDTLFLIASCSKPFASACVLRLTEQSNGKFGLNDGIDRWIPQFADAKVRGGDSAKRAPTVAELLSHRAGIYSQKRKMTDKQRALIREFDHTLKDAVDIMAEQPLLAQPGTEYAYSGAGYCVLGRVAELVAGGPFEKILQKQVCAPLGLTHTTYFPAAKPFVCATGFAPETAPHALGARHKFPLIGGSLYTTADEMIRLGQSVAGFVPTESGAAFFSPQTWKELMAVRKPTPGYALGWNTLRNNGRIIRISHGGSLQSYRSFIAVDLKNKTTVAATWTLPGPNDEVGKQIKTALTAAMDNM
ncbi:MAG: beta-lactamase family protein, partial [Kiritimatiellales bacterium]|nr:beta-lactamase family protein [Kiritimatiellales bacterium]